MSRELHLPTITVQHDLPDVVREIRRGDHAVEDCWTSIYRAGQPSVHGKMRLREGDTAGLIELEARDGVDCELLQVDPPALTVACPSLDVHPTRVSFPKASSSAASQLQLKGGADVLSIASDGSRLVMGGKNGLARVVNLAGPSNGTQVPLRGHAGDITTAQFFPSNEVVLTGSLDMSVKVFSAQDGSCPRTLTGHTKFVTSLAILGRGREVLSASLDGTLRQWNVASGECTKKWTLSQPITSMVLVKDPTDDNDGTEGALALVAHSNGTATILPISRISSAPIASLQPGASAATDAVAWHPASSSLALGSRSGTVYIYNIATVLSASVGSEVQDASSATIEPLLAFSRSGAAIKALAFSDVVASSQKSDLDLLMASADGLPCRVKLDLDAKTATVAEEFAGLDCDASHGILEQRLGQGAADRRIYVAGADGQIRQYA